MTQSIKFRYGFSSFEKLDSFSHKAPREFHASSDDAAAADGSPSMLTLFYGPGSRALFTELTAPDASLYLRFCAYLASSENFTRW